MTSPIAELIVAVGSDGRVTVQSSMSKALSEDPALRADVDQVQDTLKKELEVLDSSSESSLIQKSPAGQLVTEEEVVVGSVGWGACA